MRLRKSRAVRYSTRPTCRSAEALRLLSCGCAHFRVQPGTARQLTTTQPPVGYLASGRPEGLPRAQSPDRVTASPIAPKGHRELSRPEGPPRCRCRQLSWSFLPLRRLSSGESTPPRLASPGTFRPQGFTPSRRLTPRLNARPCFVPETPMGFPLSRGFPSPPGPADSSPRDYPLGVLPPHQRIVDARRPSPHAETRFSDLCRLQGLAPTVNPYHHRTVTSLAMADPLLSFSASPGSCPTLTGHVACYARRSCASPCLSIVISQPPTTYEFPPTASSSSPGQAQARSPLPSSVSRGHAHDLPPTGRVRSNGFTRKRGIPLRGAKTYPPEVLGLPAA
jgi:hypothetical protein